ncbi:MAG: nuclear transport factor 2 family protein [candidate division WOR-3 bacterium]|nr:MAG: nuclear transport factor 2 family protein [candidate division WOR-3 bacterium]
MIGRSLTSAFVCVLFFCMMALSADTIPGENVVEEEVEMSHQFTFNTVKNQHDELAEVEKTIRASIEWAVHDKDTAMSYSSVVNNDELFFFQTDSRSTIIGFEAFKNMTENFFMRDDFKAIKVVIKDLRIHMSPTLKTAWWACLLDDYNEFQGKPANWENVRWSGVLEKVEGKWKIFQMHFSKAEDLITN